MPRAPKQTENETVAPKTTSGGIVSDQLEEVLAYLRRMERRDRLRTTGGFIRGVLGLIPLILLVWSAWYFYQYSDEILTRITTEAVRQSASFTQDGMMEQLQQYMQR